MQPEVSLNLSRNVVLLGKSVSFNCSIGPELLGAHVMLLSPDGQVITGGSSDIVVSMRTETTKVYTISSVKPSHAGRYYCNVTGYLSASQPLYVQCKRNVCILYYF